jgi:hypothetical protein
MHDDQNIYPPLPKREPDAGMWERTQQAYADAEHAEWLPCWEFVLTHDLSASEGAAFWNGASLAMRGFTDRLEAAEAKVARVEALIREREDWAAEKNAELQQRWAETGRPQHVYGIGATYGTAELRAVLNPAATGPRTHATGAVRAAGVVGGSLGDGDLPVAQDDNDGGTA